MFDIGNVRWLFETIEIDINDVKNNLDKRVEVIINCLPNMASKSLMMVLTGEPVGSARISRLYHELYAVKNACRFIRICDMPLPSKREDFIVDDIFTEEGIRKISILPVATMSELGSFGMNGIKRAFIGNNEVWSVIDRIVSMYKVHYEATELSWQANIYNAMVAMSAYLPIWSQDVKANITKAVAGLPNNYGTMLKRYYDRDQTLEKMADNTYRNVDEMKRLIKSATKMVFSGENISIVFNGVPYSIDTYSGQDSIRILGMSEILNQRLFRMGIFKMWQLIDCNTVLSVKSKSPELYQDIIRILEYFGFTTEGYR